MSQIFIIHDLSQSRRWLHWLLLFRAGDLSKSGIELAPFNPWVVDSVPHYCHLWLPRSKDEAIPAWLESQWKSMEASLESGRDLLLLVHSPWLGAHRFFHETLRERPQTKAHTVKNNTLLNLACKKYPDFVAHFLAAIKTVRGKREKQMTSQVN